MNGNGYKPELKDALRALRLPVFAAEHSATGAIAANEGWTFDRFLPELCRYQAHNRPLRPIRSRVEKIFGTWKRSYRFRCMRWIGLAKARLQVHLAVIAYNVKRYWRMQGA